LIDENLIAGCYAETFAKTPPFAQFQRQTQILSLEILNVFLHLKFLPSLNLNKIEHFSKGLVLCTENSYHDVKQSIY